jgi:hypothetical protein
VDDGGQIAITRARSFDLQPTKTRERRILIIRNTVIITVQQKKRPQVLVRLPLVHRFS